MSIKNLRASFIARLDNWAFPCERPNFSKTAHLSTQSNTMLLLRNALNATKRQVTVRGYATSSGGARSFYYQYGTPIVRCTVVASGTTLALQLLWQNLEYREFRDETEAYVTKLEERLKTLEQQ
ncbi:uncharacterized protein BYT42DRAFT_612191 [Radiomyces spectabilis]|uniref:uncharacterized protein n=1 Tax=Radiomyces spectabilis TaxID=64574 RepID=UPI002220D473|nr:uncharacterized protein BYT42DRAFT_612191 [Radiomyces spectabilis]KAI8384494.1 hypothetical protein BYT42DRAFT_612191 [Radiomyces spectabilis]